MFEPLLYLIYINDLPNNLISSTKRFSGDKPIFYIVHCVKQYCDNLNIDLTVVNNYNWAYRWKISSNRDPNKQVAEVIVGWFLKKNKDSQKMNLSII